MSGVRQPRSTWVGVVIVVVFFAGVTLAVAMVGGGGPGIPHPAGDGRAACVTCHPTAGLPDDHHDRVNDSCRSCHSEKSADAERAPSGRPYRDGDGEGEVVAVSLVSAEVPMTSPAPSSASTRK